MGVMAKYRITSANGKTHVYDEDGKELVNVVALEITQSSSHNLVAKITLIAVQPDIDVEVEAKNG